MAFKCSASRDLPLNTDKAWDGSAAAKSIFDANSDADGNVTAGARRGFLAYDASEPTLRGSYKLPFAQVLNGRLTALASGLRAAASRLPQTDGLSPEVRDKARGVIEHYLDKMHEEGESEEERAAGGIMLARLDLETRAIRQPKGREDLPQELLAQVRDASILERGLPYLNQAWGSTDRVDTYSTRMQPSSLRNFAEDATNGISIQNSHKVDELSLGRTYSGSFKTARNGGISRTEMDFYIPPDLVINGTHTNHVIDGIRWGTINDVSVGFFGGHIRCSLCQKPMLRDLGFLLFFGGDDEDQETRDPEAPCHHIPGVEYPTRDRLGKKTGERAVAIGDIEDAHCAELSFVFDGATPKAEIRGRQTAAMAKAVRMIELDVLPRRPAMALESSFRGHRMLSAITARRYGGFSSYPQVDPDDDPLPDLEQPDPQPDPEPLPDPEPQPDPAPEPVPVSQPVAEVPPMSEPSDRAQPIETDVSASARAPDPVDPLMGIRAQMISTGLAPEGFQGDVGQRFRELGTELQDLRGWADVGRQARERLVEDCRRAGVRAFGKSGLPEAAYGPILTRGSYQEIQDLFQHLTEIGTMRFPAGRATEDGEPSTVVPEPTHISEPLRVPTRAFRA